MPRRNRSSLPGRVHHVTARGNNRQQIFLDSTDRERFLDLLDEACDTTGIAVHELCLMGNHYHLIVGAGLPAMSATLHRLNSRYANSFNQRHGRSNHVFGRRFFSVPINRLDHAVAAARYVALNPVRANICPSPDAWEWSSHANLDARLWCLDRSWRDRVFAAAELDYDAYIIAAVGTIEPGRPSLDDLIGDHDDELGMFQAVHGYRYTSREIAAAPRRSTPTLSRRLAIARSEVREAIPAAESPTLHRMEPMEQLVVEIERAFADVERRLQDPEIVTDQQRLAEAGRAHRRLGVANDLANRWRDARQQAADAAELLETETDPETRAFLQTELESARELLPGLEDELRFAMLERDPADDKDVIVEIRAGTGGEEAALFAADLYRMLIRYAERRKFKHQVLSTDGSEAGGFRDVTIAISGDGAYSIFKWESGVHRVQRVPATESQGRIHTSTATIAVLPEAEEVEVRLDPKDLTIETIRGWGPGGQSVNTTDSAVRVIHAPTGLMVVCQDERSQLQNKERALRILRARVYEIERERAQQELDAARRSQIGSGARSEKIRTYNFPQSRVTDHRIKHTSHNLQGVLDGGLDEFTDAIQADDNRRKLADATAGTALAG